MYGPSFNDLELVLITVGVKRADIKRAGVKRASNVY